MRPKQPSFKGATPEERFLRSLPGMGERASDFIDFFGSPIGTLNALYWFEYIDDDTLGALGLSRKNVEEWLRILEGDYYNGRR